LLNEKLRNLILGINNFYGERWTCNREEVIDSIKILIITSKGYGEIIFRIFPRSKSRRKTDKINK
jgi:hypothetical protein